MIKLKWLCGAVSIFCLTSCQIMDDAVESPSDTTKDEMLTETFGARSSYSTESPEPPASDDILNSLLPPIELNKSSKVNETRFDVQADQLALNQFLLGLVEGTTVNMLVDPGLTQPITLHLKNVTIREVLSLLQKTQDIDIQQQGNIYYVGGSQLQTAVYPLDYLNLVRSGLSRTQVSSGQIYANNQNQQDGNQSDNRNNRNGGGSGGGNNVSTLNSSRIETESETNLWEEIQNTLNALVAQEEGSYVMVSPQTGSVIVKARPIIQRQIAEFLGVAQANLNRQVILEAKILEVSLNDKFQAGVNWSKVQTAGDGSVFALGQLGQVLETDGAQSPINGVFNLLYETDPADGDPFSAAIDLLEEQGNVQVLSSPRVSTINNQKAVIKVGTDEFFVTEISTTTTSGINTSTTPEVTLTPFFSGIALDVMPQVSANGDVILHVHPSVSEVTDQTKVVTVGNQNLSLPLALSSVRESDSIVKTRSGQVVVIGGLMQNRMVDSDAGTPVLSRIPVIGNLFKQQRESKVKSELVILLKATVVEGSEWNQQVRESELRFKRLNE